MSVKLDQTPAALLGAKEAPPPTPAPNGAASSPLAGEVVAPPPAPAFDELWVRKCVILFCNGLAEEWGDGMKATELELAILVPVLHAMAWQHAPEFMAGQAADANLWVLGAIVLYMGARRGLAVRRRRREQESIAGTPHQKPAAPAAAAAAAASSSPASSASSENGHAPAGGAFGSRPVVLGGRLGDGRSLRPATA